MVLAWLPNAGTCLYDDGLHVAKARHVLERGMGDVFRGGGCSIIRRLRPLWYPYAKIS